MTFFQRRLFHLLRFMDDLWPGWAAPKPERADYLSHEAFQFWMTREGRR